jgi:hypothetical protein
VAFVLPGKRDLGAPVCVVKEKYQPQRHQEPLARRIGAPTGVDHVREISGGIGGLCFPSRSPVLFWKRGPTQLRSENLEEGLAAVLPKKGPSPKSFKPRRIIGGFCGFRCPVNMCLFSDDSHQPHSPLSAQL